MTTSSSSAPGASTPGGELQQISPGAWPTANGGQKEQSVPPVAIPAPPAAAASIPIVAEQLRDNWERTKDELRKKWGELTDEDLRYAPGQELALIDRIRQKTGCTRAEIEAALRVNL